MKKRIFFLVFTILPFIGISQDLNVFHLSYVETDSLNKTGYIALTDEEIWNREVNITPLPFGPEVSNPIQICSEDHLFYTNLISKNSVSDTPTLTKSKKLPHIKDYRYVEVDTNRRSNCTYGDKDTSYIFLDYKVRLPDLGKWQVYYNSGMLSDSSTYLKNKNVKCSEYLYTNYGHLILYDTSNSFAIVMAIYFEKYIDAYSTRRFFIDEKYNLFICNVGYAEGEEGVDEYISSKYKVKFKPDGSIKYMNWE